MSKIIAEIGVNWSGDLLTARGMIIQSARAGANYVKFQLFNNEIIKDSIYKNGLSNMILDADFINYLSRTAKSNDIGFGISVMYKEGFYILDTLESNSIQFIKIRFADRNNDDIVSAAIKYCRKNKVDLIVSTDNIHNTSSQLYSQHNKDMFSNIYYIYCVPKYPPELNEIDIKKIFELDGYSNHYPSKELLMFVASRNPKIIEIHVKRKMDYGLVLPQLDEKVSINFEELEQVCKFHKEVLRLYYK